MAGGLADKFTGALNKAQAANDKKSVTEEKKDETKMISGETTVPFPVITNKNLGEEFNLPPINVDAFTKSPSNSSIPFGLNSNDNPFSDLLLINLK